MNSCILGQWTAQYNRALVLNPICGVAYPLNSKNMELLLEKEPKIGVLYAVKINQRSRAALFLQNKPETI